MLDGGQPIDRLLYHKQRGESPIVKRPGHPWHTLTSSRRVIYLRMHVDTTSPGVRSEAESGGPSANSLGSTTLLLRRERRLDLLAGNTVKRLPIYPGPYPQNHPLYPFQCKGPVRTESDATMVSGPKLVLAPDESPIQVITGRQSCKNRSVSGAKCPSFDTPVAQPSRPLPTHRSSRSQLAPRNQGCQEYGDSLRWGWVRESSSELKERATCSTTTEPRFFPTG